MFIGSHGLGEFSMGSFTQTRCCLPTTGKASLSAQAAASIVPAWEKSTVKQPIWPPRNDSMGLLGIRQTFNRKTLVMLVKYLLKQHWSSYFVFHQAVFSCWATVKTRYFGTKRGCNIHLSCITWDAKASLTLKVFFFFYIHFSCYVQCGKWQQQSKTFFFF